jgi:hypothetical protein
VKRLKAQDKAQTPPELGTPANPVTLNFFARFHPDGEARENFMNTVLLYGFFTGASTLFSPWLKFPFDAASAGDKRAAEFLLNVAAEAALLVGCLAERQPQMMQDIARKQVAWPIFATTQLGWEKDAVARLTQLGLGLDKTEVDTRFRKALGQDQNYPGRLWAKNAVRCVNTTRCLQRALSRKTITGADLWQGPWRRGKEPAWAAKTGELPDFSKASVRQWTEVVREMIREQIPDFHLRPEWQSQWNSCKQRERGTKGAIQNTILDDIVDALRTVAP